MHFEILVEDQSGMNALNILVPKIIGDGHFHRTHPSKGAGCLPKDMRPRTEASKRILLDQLPRRLRGYGKSSKGYDELAIIVVCDLDSKCLKAFREELLGVLIQCHPQPETRFCIAVEEIEAWLLGDLKAVKEAYPKARDDVLNSYENDSICGTWEELANAVYPGGSDALSKKGYQSIGKEKSEWAKKITPLMDIDRNKSPSFNYFRSKLLELASA